MTLLLFLLKLLTEHSMKRTIKQKALRGCNFSWLLWQQALLIMHSLATFSRSWPSSHGSAGLGHTVSQLSKLAQVTMDLGLVLSPLIGLGFQLIMAAPSSLPGLPFSTLGLDLSCSSTSLSLFATGSSTPSMLESSLYFPTSYSPLVAINMTLPRSWLPSLILTLMPIIVTASSILARFSLYPLDQDLQDFQQPSFMWHCFMAGTFN